ncbi:MAG: amidase [Acidimicrobiales bacterium]|jgi:amidase|nr:amidase [Acidimicrobiales bacterium]
MGMSEELRWTDAVGTAELIARGELTAAEAVEAALERIDAGNPTLNAVIHRRDDAARAEAARMDAGKAPNPFRGTPMLVKDALCQMDGDPQHLGMKALRDRGFRATGDSELARRYRAGGLVVLGRTNLPELASSATTEPVATGPTRNPWDLTRSPGGSSGGSGAAVAAGFVPVAHGNDMGGSIRIPAAHCGLVGLKPTRGRTSLGPQFGEYWGPLTHEHVLTRTVRDCAAVLDVSAGAAPGDPHTAPPHPRPFLAEVGAGPGRLRIGVLSTKPDGSPVHPECAAAVAGAAAALTALGHTVDAGHPEGLDDGGMRSGFGIVTAVHVASEIARLERLLGEPIDLAELEPMNRASAEGGRMITGLQLLEARAAMEAAGRRIAAWWSEGWDLLLTPTSAAIPAVIGDMGPLAPDPIAGGMLDHVAFTTAFDVTGQPAVSLPLHWTPEGLPVGVQLVAAFGREDLLLRVASQLEAAVPWADRHPPVPGAA